MPLTAFLIGLYGFAILSLLIAIGHGAGARSTLRETRAHGPERRESEDHGSEEI